MSGAGPEAAGATLGLVTGAAFYAVLTMTGFGLLLAQVGWLAGLIQIAGGCYLIHLGILAWRSGGPVPSAQQPSSGTEGLWLGLRMGVLVELANPKGIAFFVSLYAVAVPPETALRAKLVILLGGFVLEIAWYGIVAICLSSRPARLAYARFGRRVERGIGTLLAALGLHLITEKL